MARQPGWYQDPEDLPGVFRWWDGETWTVDVTTDPRTARSPDDPAYEDASAAPQRREPSRTGVSAKTVRRIVYLVVILVVVVNGAKVVRAVLNIDLFAGSADIGMPDLDLPDLDLPDLEEGPGSDGRYDGGGISYAAIEGRWTRTFLVSNVPMNDLDGEETVVASPANGRPQYAYVWVGTVEPALVEGDLAATARTFADRFAAEAYPTDARLDDSDRTRIRVGRFDGIRLTRHYAYRVRGTQITGEELTVVLVDNADVPAVGVATVPDGFPAVRTEVRQALDSLRAS